MEFYEAVNHRRTAREWRTEEVSPEALERIIGAALKAPTNDHNRQWEFVILNNSSEKEKVLKAVREGADRQVGNGIIPDSASPAKIMFSYAMPRQYSMLASAPVVIIPFFKEGGIYNASSLSALNSYASMWCAIENLFLAASAEGMACSMRIPLREEAQYVEESLGAPAEYAMACYIGLGYPTDTALNLPQNNYTAAQKMHLGKW